jgi:hypothetical protein
VKDLDRFISAFQKLDRLLEEERTTLVSTGNLSAAQKLEEQMRINGQAYFLLIWGQIEQAVDDACRSTIRSRRSGKRAERRGWDIYNPDDKRLSGLAFHDRAALVLDRYNPKGEYAKLIGYYEQRNQIAHGKSYAFLFDIADVAADFRLIQSRFEP